MQKIGKIAMIKFILDEGKQLHKEGKIDEAIDKYSEALQANHKYRPALKQLASIYEDRQEFDKAIEYYQSIVKHRPTDSLSYANLANLLLKQGKILESIANYQKAISIKSDLPESVYIGLGNALSQNGQADEAIAAHKKAMERQSEKSNFLLRHHWINHDLKIIFCAIPKNANTLFKTTLLDNSSYGEVYQQAKQARNLDVHQYFLNKDIRETFSIRDISYLYNEEYFKFVILRNPFKRLVSAYFNKIVRPCIALKRRNIKPQIPPKGSSLENLIREVYEFMGVQPDFAKSITFEQFVRYVARTKDVDLNLHWRPQHTFLGLFEYDFIGQFEKLDLVIEHLEKKFDIRISQGATVEKLITNYRKFSSSENFWNKYPEYFLDFDTVPTSSQLYTPELEEIVRERYAEDIKLYEREFNINPRP